MGFANQNGKRPLHIHIHNWQTPILKKRVRHDLPNEEDLISFNPNYRLN